MVGKGVIGMVEKDREKAKNTVSVIARLHADAIYSKKQHYAAADRKGGYHKRLGVPVLIINLITGSTLFAIIQSSNVEWIEYLIATLILLAAILGSVMTFFEFAKQSAANRTIANRYLAIAKKCRVCLAKFEDGIIEPDEFGTQVNELYEEYQDIHRAAEGCPTSCQDYEKAKKQIEEGEEDYTDEELNLIRGRRGG